MKFQTDFWHFVAFFAYLLIFFATPATLKHAWKTFHDQFSMSSTTAWLIHRDHLSKIVIYRWQLHLSVAVCHLLEQVAVSDQQDKQVSHEKKLQQSKKTPFIFQQLQPLLHSCLSRRWRGVPARGWALHDTFFGGGGGAVFLIDFYSWCSGYRLRGVGREGASSPVRIYIQN